MTASILFVVGGEAIQSYVFETFGHAYWSAAFECVLEKHGILDYDKHEPEVLSDSETLARYRILIVAWLPPARWSPRYLKGLREFDGIVLLEGPVPGYVETATGFRRGPASLHAATIEVKDPRIARRLAGCAVPGADKTRFELAPRQVETRATVDSRWNPDGFDSHDFPAAAARVCASFRGSYILRLRRHALFGQATSNVLMIAFLVMYAERGPGLERSDAERAGAILDAIDPEDLEAYVYPVYAKVRYEIDRVRGHRRERGWRDRVQDRLRLADNIPLLPRGLAATARSVLAETFAGAWSWPLQVRAVVNGLIEGAGSAVRWRGSLNTLQLHQLAIALCGCRRWQCAREILTRALAEALERETGVMRNGEFSGRGFTACGHGVADPIVPLAHLLLLRATASARAHTTPAASAYSPDQVRSWIAPPYTIVPGVVVGGEEILHAHAAGASGTVLYRSGKFVVSSFQALAYVAHFHSMPPLEEAFQACEPDTAVLLEATLLASLDVQARDYGQVFARIRPWPRDLPFAVTVRHDADRIPTAAQLDALIAFEQKHALGVTWFWIHDRLDESLMRRLVDSGHEVGLHAVRLARKGAERAAIEAAVPGLVVRGESLHGGGGDFWRGHPSVAAAQRCGLGYTEGVPTLMDYPYRFPQIDQRGAVTLMDICCMTHCYSVDDGVTRKRRYVRAEALVALRAAQGHYLVILNHPDMNLAELRRLLTELASRPCWSATQAEVRAWWQRTHRRDRVRLARAHDTSGRLAFELTTRDAVSDVAVELLGAGAGRDERSAAAQRTVLSTAAGTPHRVEFEVESSPRFADLVEVIPAAVRGANDTAAEMFARVAKLAQVVRTFTPLENLIGKRVFDFGCAYGAFALAYFMGERPANLVGVEGDGEYVEIGNRMAARAGTSAVRFERVPLDRFAYPDATAFDVVIANNSINRIGSRRATKAALRGLYDLLAPGGAIVLLSPNRLYPREAFSGLAGVQFMPRWLAEWYVRWRGRRRDYRRIRLPSPFELRRWLLGAGFSNVRVIDAYTLEARGVARFFKPRFYVTAVR